MRLENRTGKVISLGRLTLALFILLAMYAGAPHDPAGSTAALMVARGYFILAGLLLAVTWSSWWLEHRLKLPSHLLDIAFFIALAVFTGREIASPFFIFFVFLVLSAAAKWGWRGALWTAIAATLLFAAQTLVAAMEGPLSAADYVRTTVRAGHLLVLSLMIGWFGFAHGTSSQEKKRFPSPDSMDPPVGEAVRHMADCLCARMVTLVWSDPDEPWVEIAVRRGEGELKRERAGPSDIEWLVAPELAGRTFLFDVRKQRALLSGHGGLESRSGVDALNPALARRLGIESGLATPLKAEGFDGYFIAAGIPSMCWDDLIIARRVAEDIASAFDRSAALRASAATAEASTRLNVARDLHDSMAQILAGIGLKLRAARTGLPDGPERDQELRTIEKELVMYQHYLHEFIGDLRNPGDMLRIDLSARLQALALSLERQWDVEVSFSGDDLPRVPRAFALEVGYLMREAVANAVRHGHATRIEIGATSDEREIELAFRDNGRGFGKIDEISGEGSDAARAPRSINERVRLLGGSVGLVSTSAGAIVTLRLPLESAER